MAKTDIRKKVFSESMKCSTLGWQINSEPSSPVESISTMLSIEEGLEIHNRARTVFKEGVLVQGDNVSSAEQTKSLLRNGEVSVIFEATFIVDGYIAKADILKREASGWRLFEVKSGVNDKKDYIDDFAYTVMVAQRANLDVAGCSLMLLSRDYRLGMEDSKLFVEIEHTEDVIKRANEFAGCWDNILKAASQSTKPTPTI